MHLTSMRLFEIKTLRALEKGLYFLKFKSSYARGASAFSKVLLKISFCKLRLQSFFQKEFPLNSLQETADSETEVSRNYIPKRIYINIDRAYPYQY